MSNSNSNSQNNTSTKGKSKPSTLYVSLDNADTVIEGGPAHDLPDPTGKRVPRPSFSEGWVAILTAQSEPDKAVYHAD